jgi:hypothetical protein
MGWVTDDDLLPEAVAELYASGPEEFIKRRGELAARARAAGQAALAKRIAGLRKPTRSAWIINQLIRSDPAVSAQLADLGEQLRAAQSLLDGVAIRDLSLQRRQLIDALARQAFAVAGQPSPPAAIRDEVTATLGAALADPQVADRVRAGTLERAVHREGFGSEGFGTAGAQVLALVRSPAGGGPVPGGKKAAPAGEASTAAPDRRQAKTTELAAARARAERGRRRQAIAEAERETAEAGWALEAAEKTEREQERVVQRLKEQLADARQRLADAQLDAREAATAQRHALKVLGRLRK